jgi:hypothetical protein
MVERPLLYPGVTLMENLLTQDSKMTSYLYRRGDGNEGNFIRAIVTLTDKDNPYAALKALVANDYIAGKRVRKHIIRAIDVDGEAEFGIHATVYEGPDGETAFDAAWLTAELQPLNKTDTNHYQDHSSLLQGNLKTLLDNPAWRMYRTELKEKV